MHSPQTIVFKSQPEPNRRENPPKPPTYQPSNQQESEEIESETTTDQKPRLSAESGSEPQTQLTVFEQSTEQNLTEEDSSIKPLPGTSATDYNVRTTKLNTNPQENNQSKPEALRNASTHLEHAGFPSTSTTNRAA